MHRLCYCRVRKVNPENANRVINGTPFCFQQCVRERRNHIIVRWLIAAASIAITLLAIVGIQSAFAAPPPNANPAWGAWFRSLRDASGTSCCSEADCRIVYSWRIGKKGYEANMAGKWVEIPASTVIHRPDNPTGQAVLCAVQYGDNIHIYCFQPGAGM